MNRTASEAGTASVSANWRRRILRGAVVVSLLLPLSGCTPALVRFLPAYTFRVVDAETGAPIEGAAFLIAWYVCTSFSGNSEAIGGWGGRSDAKGEIHVPSRTIPGTYSIFKSLCFEQVWVFKAGGWVSPTPVFHDVGGSSKSFGFPMEGEGVQRVELHRTERRSERVKSWHSQALHPSDKLPADATNAIGSEWDRERTELGL